MAWCGLELLDFAFSGREHFRWYGVYKMDILEEKFVFVYLPLKGKHIQKVLMG